MEIFANGIEQKTEDLKRLVIYGRGKILYEIERGYMEPQRITVNDAGEKKLSSIYAERIERINLAQPIKRALKENLNRTDNYYMKHTGNYSFESGKALYIHESEITVTDMGDILSMETDEEKNYLHAVKVHFNSPVIIQNLHYERIQAGGHWTIPDGGKWGSGYGTEEKPQYEVYDDNDLPEFLKNKRLAAGQEITRGVIKRYYTLDETSDYETIVTFRFYSRMEVSMERKRKNEIAERLNASREYKDNKWSHYDITKLENALGYKLT